MKEFAIGAQVLTLPRIRVILILHCGILDAALAAELDRVVYLTQNISAQRSVANLQRFASPVAGAGLQDYFYVFDQGISHACLIKTRNTSPKAR